MNQPPVQVKPAQPPHVCLSGTLSCSGSIPCEPCEALVREFVLPHALAAIGLTPSTPQAIQAIEAFYAGMIQGWATLHTLMVQNAELGAALKITPIHNLIAGPTHATVPVEQQALPNMPPALDPLESLVPNGGPGAKVTSAELDGLLSQQASRNRSRAGAMTEKMNEEDIANSIKPVVIGNVMGK